MDHSKKLDFIHKMTKLGLQHFDTGGLAGQAGNLLGINDNYTASALTPGTSSTQLNNAYQGVQNDLGQSYNQSQALNGGVQAGANQQAALAQQLQAQANGQGPNVAQNQLNQATGANVANQAALMAGQRGSSSNVGLLARQSAQQGAATQQNAAGQAATLGAQQQLAAQSALGNLSAQQIAQGQSSLQNDMNAQQGEQSILQQANSNYNTATNNQSQINASVNAANQQASNGLLSGLSGAVSGVTGMIGSLFAQGGQVGAPQSAVGRFLNDNSSSQTSSMSQNLSQSSQKLGQNIANAFNSISSNSTPSFSKQNNSIPKEAASIMDTSSAPQMMSAMGDSMMMAAKGGPVKQMQAKGGKVKADTKEEKAKVKGNSYSNDTIPAMLSEGEIVLPREVTQHPNAPEMAAEFVRQTLAKKRVKSK